MCLGLSSFAQNWNEIIKTTASDREVGDNLGWAVCISGDYAIVGAYLEDDDHTGTNEMIDAGSAYVLERNEAGVWNEVQKIVASDRATFDHFGWSVSISGNYAIVGAYHESEDVAGGNTMIDAGSAYVFERNESGEWNEVQKIVASDRFAGDKLGYSVSISGDYALVGAYFEDEDIAGDNTITDAGSVYVFERNGFGLWTETQKIVASDRASDDRFGYSVSISGDYSLVGAYYKNAAGGESMTHAGSAYIFERNGSGEWDEVQKIEASDMNGDDRFGYSVSISGDYAVVGAILEDEDTAGINTMDKAGSAYLFERNESGLWNEMQKIVASDRAALDYFGWSVSISGNYALVGAYTEDEDATGGNTISGAGSAYVFERNESGSWIEVQKIVASDRASSDFFATSVSISGNHAILGANWEDEDTIGDNTMNQAGSAYIFKNGCQLLSGTVNDTICFQDTVYVNGSAYSFDQATGTEVFTNIGPYNCDSTVTVALNVLAPIDITISHSEGTLTSNQNGATYQWIDCNGEPINPSENNQNFTASANGNYAVIVTINGCSDTSACYYVIITGIIENDFGNELSIYPNPTDGIFSIDLGIYSNTATITISDLNGKIVSSRNYSESQLTNIKIDEPKGIYLLMVESGNKKAIVRLVKR